MRTISLLPLTLVIASVGCPMPAFGQSTSPKLNGDANGDGTIDVSDAVYLLNWQFHGGPTPVELFCGSETSTSEIFLMTAEKIEGSSWLARDDESITMRLGVESSPPGHTMTVWWVIFNNPERCGKGEGPCGSADLFDPEVETDLLFADGNVVGDSGKVEFAGHLRVGDTPESINHLLSAEPVGLLNPRGAEVHLLVRSHGPADPETLAAQVNSFAGGCIEFLKPPEIPDAPGECADVLFSVHMPPASDS